MRTGAAVAIVVVAAVLGGVAALGIGAVSGLTNDTAGETVYVSVPRVGGTPSPSSPNAGTTAPGGEFEPAAIYADRADGVVTIYTAFQGSGGGGQGSGFIVGEDGTILTNAHVITNVGDTDGDERGADAVFVEFSDGERVPAEIVGWDVFADVGVIRVDPEGHGLAPIPLGDSDQVVPGSSVAAIGSPFGNQGSLAVGVVSATGRTIPSLTSVYSVADAIQIDAPINRGNSGGPLLDAGGRAIGINAQIRSESGGAEGVGFAIPINVARRSLDQLAATGRVAYAYIGIRTETVTPGIADRFGLGAERGALIQNVESGTPAARAGLRGGEREEAYNGLTVTLGGDLIVKIGDEEVHSADDVSRIVTHGLLPGESVPFVVIRDGKREQIDVTLGERPRESG